MYIVYIFVYVYICIYINIYIYRRDNGIYIQKKLQHMDSLSLFLFRCRAEQEKEERARRAAKRAKKIEERRRSKIHLLIYFKLFV